uniref:Uncharacterized protein n=1 Tax=Ditylenchus dipsaci TaxID=166011 RepID=A0A915EDG2_9BILA
MITSEINSLKEEQEKYLRKYVLHDTVQIQYLNEQIEEKLRLAEKKQIEEKMSLLIEKLATIQEENTQTKTAKSKGRKKDREEPRKQKVETRNVQIEKLKKQLEGLVSDLLPSLKTLKEEASHAKLGDMGLDKKEHEAYQLMQKLQAELESKEEEQAKADHFMQAVDELNLLISEPIAALSHTTRLDSDTAQAQLQASEAKALILKEVIAKAEEEPSVELTKEEQILAAKTEENAKDYLKNLLDKCAQLQLQLDLVAELEKQDKALKEKINALGEDVNSIFSLYQQQSPQSLLAAEDDLRRADSVKARLDEANQQLEVLKKWTGTQLPNDQQANKLLEDTNQTLTQLNSQLLAVTVPLKDHIEVAKNQEAYKNNILDSIKELSGQAQNVHNLADANQKSTELQKLQNQIEPLKEQLIQLQQQISAVSVNNAFVGPVELDSVQENLDGLANLLNNEEMDAARKLNNAATAANIQQEAASLRNKIHKAERLDSDPNATEKDLQMAKNILEDSKQHLENIQHAADSLDVNDQEANLIQNNASNDQSQLGETLSILLQSLEDRLDAIQAFNQDQQKVKSELANLEQALQNSKTSEQLQELLLNNEKLLPELASLQALADSIKPMLEASAQVDSLQHQQANLDNQIRKARDAAAEDEKHQAAVQIYSEQLEALEDKLKQAEHDFVALVPTVDNLNAFSTQLLDPVLEQYQSIELTTPPTEDLKRRKQQLKKQTAKLQAKAVDKLKNAVEQDELVVRLNNEIGQNEAVLAHLLSRYEQPQSQDQAVEDLKAVENIRQSVIALPLDEVSDKSVRQKLSSRLEPLHIEANEFVQSLAQDIATSQQLQVNFNDLTKGLSATEAELAALAKPEVANHELLLLTKSADLEQSIQVLRKDLDKINTQIEASSSKLIQTAAPMKPSELKQKIDQLDNANKVNTKKALHSQKVATLTPQLEAISVTLQSTMDQLEDVPQTSLDQQETTLRKLEEEKQKMHTLLESIPEEAEELREKSKWELSRLSDFIKRLGEAVGDKVAALTAFLAAKSEVESQLEQVGRQLDEDLADSSISALNEQQLKIEKLQQKLANEVAVNSLDEDKNNELSDLKKALELMTQRIQHQIALKNAADQLSNHVNQTNTDLVSLIDQANRLLNDAAAIPQTYQQLAGQIQKAIEQAQDLVQQDPSAETLQGNIAQAGLAQNKLDDRWNTWLAFVEERNLANTQLDNARKPLANIEKKPVRDLDEAQQDLADLIDGQGALAQLNESLEKLQPLADQLDPLESSYADVRFLDVDYEQTERQYSSILDDLRREIDEENQLVDTAKQLEAELNNLQTTARTAGDINLVEDCKTKALPELHARLNALKKKTEKSKSSAELSNHLGSNQPNLKLLLVN